MKMTEKLPLPSNEKANFYCAEDGCKLYIYDYRPIEKYKFTIFVISGITGINHNTEKDIIDQLSNAENRVVVIHPRGTGYSDGKRGDISDFSVFINDYIQIIKNDSDYKYNRHKQILYGHSMSSAIVLEVAGKLGNISGAILVNPPLLLKKAKGMTPNFFQYVKYACYLIFAKHSPIVNMAGNPSLIEDETDRNEAKQRANDPMLQQYFSMYMMLASKKVMDASIKNAMNAHYPLLLIYGAKDNIVDKKGCDKLFEAWKCETKQYVIIENGKHGKSTLILAGKSINEWLNER